MAPSILMRIPLAAAERSRQKDRLGRKGRRGNGQKVYTPIDGQSDMETERGAQKKCPVGCGIDTAWDLLPHELPNIRVFRSRKD